MRVRELAEWLGATFEGDGEKELSGVAALETAGSSDLAFVGTRKAAAAADSFGGRLPAGSARLAQPQLPDRDPSAGAAHGVRPRHEPVLSHGGD